MAKLKTIVEGIFDEDREIDKNQVIESVKNYSLIGKQLYDGHNIIQMAEQIAEIGKAAQDHILSETDEWFDKVSVNRNMKNMKGMVKEFAKTAKESHIINQRMTALYEDMGTILNRYYDIDEDVKPDIRHDAVKEEEEEAAGLVGIPALGQFVKNLKR